MPALATKTNLEQLRKHLELAAFARIRIQAHQEDCPESDKETSEKVEAWKRAVIEYIAEALKQIRVLPELQALIPPLIDTELTQLRENLIAEGVRDPLVLWLSNDGDLILLDGHNRRNIIAEESLVFEVVTLPFDSRLEAKAWMLANQLGRRNLNALQRSVMLGDYYNATKATHGGDRKSSSVQNEPLKTRAEEIAEEHGVSKSSVKRAGKAAEGIERLEEHHPEAREKALTRTDINQSDLVGLASAPEEEVAAAAIALINDEPLPKTEPKPAIDPDDPQLDLIEFINGLDGGLGPELSIRTPEPESLDHRESVRKLMTSSLTDEHATPQDLFDALNAEFGFTLDVSATAENAKCARYFDKEVDALTQSWAPLDEQDGGPGFMNHPYSQHYAFLQKAFLTAMNGERTMVCLAKVDTRTKWWWDFCRFGQVRFLEGGLVFGGAESGAPFPNAVVIFPQDMATNPKYRPSTQYWDWAGKRQAKLSILSKANFHANKAIILDDTVFAPGPEGNWGRWQTEPVLYKGKSRFG